MQLVGQRRSDLDAQQQRADPDAFDHDRRERDLIVAALFHQQPLDLPAARGGIREPGSAGRRGEGPADRRHDAAAPIPHLEQVGMGEGLEVARHPAQGRPRAGVGRASGQRHGREEAWIARDHARGDRERIQALGDSLLEHQRGSRQRIIDVAPHLRPHRAAEIGERAEREHAGGDHGESEQAPAQAEPHDQKLRSSAIPLRGSSTRQRRSP